MGLSDSMEIEILNRIKDCEQKIEELKEKINILEENKKNTVNEDNAVTESKNKDKKFKVLTRGVARVHVMRKIKELWPDARVRIGNRNEGSGIVFSDENGERKFKFYHSRNHQAQDDRLISWSGVQKCDVEKKYDGYIFSIWDGKKQYILLFTHDEIVSVIDATQKSLDTSDKLHFSFTILPDLSIYETRGSIDFDVTYSYENYSVIM